MKSSRRKRDADFDAVVWAFVVFMGLLVTLGLAWQLLRFVAFTVGELTRVL